MRARNELLGLAAKDPCSPGAPNGLDENRSTGSRSDREKASALGLTMSDINERSRARGVSS